MLSCSGCLVLVVFVVAVCPMFVSLLSVFVAVLMAVVVVVAAGRFVAMCLSMGNRRSPFLFVN